MARTKARKQQKEKAVAKREASTQVEPWTDLVPPMPFFSAFAEWSPFRLMHHFPSRWTGCFEPLLESERAFGRRSSMSSNATERSR